MIVGDIKLAFLGFMLMSFGILILSFARFLIEWQKPFAWQWHRIKNLDEALYEFNLFGGAVFIASGLLIIITQKSIHSNFDEFIIISLTSLIFGGSFIFIIYFNLRFVLLGK